MINAVIPSLLSFVKVKECSLAYLDWIKIPKDQNQKVRPYSALTYGVQGILLMLTDVRTESKILVIVGITYTCRISTWRAKCTPE